MLQGPLFVHAPPQVQHVLQDSENAAAQLGVKPKSTVEPRDGSPEVVGGAMDCQHYLPICPDFSDDLPLKFHWVSGPCLWPSGEDLN